MTSNLFRRIADWWNRPPAPACYDCGASIIAADDDARICVQCGGRNRRVGYRVDSNPPPPPVGAKPLPSPGPPWRVPDKQRQDRQERHESAGDAVATATLAPLTADEVRKIVREEIERAREIPKQEPS